MLYVERDKKKFFKQWHHFVAEKTCLCWDGNHFSHFIDSQHDGPLYILGAELREQGQESGVDSREKKTTFYISNPPT